MMRRTIVRFLKRRVYPAVMNVLHPARSVPGAVGPRVKIMPVGDSLTEGTGAPGGYRLPLWEKFAQERINAVFTGTQYGGPPELGNKKHEGYPGAGITAVAQVVNGALSKYHPDIVLLMMGTKEMSRAEVAVDAPRQLHALLDQIITFLPSARLLVTTIPPHSDDLRNMRIQDYNRALALIVHNFALQGANIELVDANSALTQDDLAPDGVHINAGGYRKISEVWYQALQPHLLPAQK